jgi:hypothetical protein
MDMPDESLREVVSLPSGRRVIVWKWRPVFVAWGGERLADPIRRTYTVKPLVDIGGERHFAEIAICRSLTELGWQAVWLDTFHGKIWSDMIDAGVPTEIPAEITDEYSGVLAVRGVWHVFAWNENRALFAESKGPRDKIRDGQLLWLDSASQSGLPLEFVIVEWSFEVAPD